MKKNVKNKIQFSNYVKLAVLFIVVIILALGIRNWYLNSVALEMEVPVIADVLTKEIKNEELYNFVNENDPSILYFSVSSDKDCRKFEEDISSFLKKSSLEDVVVYMNLQGEDVSKFFDEVTSYYKYDGKLKEVPTFIYFEDGKIKEVLTDTLEVEDVKEFFKKVGVVL